MKKLIRKYFYFAAPRAYYFVFLNALGFNVIRTVFHNLLWRLRSFVGQSSDLAVKTLEKDGIVVENFLSPEDFKKVMHLYKKVEMKDKHQHDKTIPQYAYRQISTPLNYMIKISQKLLSRIKDCVTSLRQLPDERLMCFQK